MSLNELIAAAIKCLVKPSLMHNLIFVVELLTANLMHTLKYEEVCRYLLDIHLFAAKMAAGIGLYTFHM